MNGKQKAFLLLVGIAIGLGLAWFVSLYNRPVYAFSDRNGDFALCTGPLLINATIPTEGIWLLDHKGGKLMASVIDRVAGKMSPWAELNLSEEFQLTPRQAPHFLMTTGIVGKEQSALYLTETNTGKLGIYTMAPRLDGQPGVAIRRQDISSFRKGN